MIFIEGIFLGDILVFMPGQEDIEVTCEVIKGLNVEYFYFVY